MNKMLIQLGDHVWINPQTVDAVVDNFDQSITILTESGQHLTIHGVTLDQTLDALGRAAGEQAAGQQVAGQQP